LRCFFIQTQHRIKPYITLEMRKLYYNSYILPIIDYGIILWQCAPKRKPEHMKSAKTVNTFKSMLKKHIFYTY